MPLHLISSDRLVTRKVWVVQQLTCLDENSWSNVGKRREKLKSRVWESIIDIIADQALSANGHESMFSVANVT